MASRGDLLHWILTLPDEKSKYGHNFITTLLIGRPFLYQFLRNSQLLDDDIRRSSLPNLAGNLFWVWQTCYSVTGIWASKTSVMPENWTQQHVTQWGITLAWYTTWTTKPHQLDHELTTTNCSSQSIIYVTVNNRQRIHLFYLPENSVRLI